MRKEIILVVFLACLPAIAVASNHSLDCKTLVPGDWELLPGTPEKMQDARFLDKQEAQRYDDSDDCGYVSPRVVTKPLMHIGLGLQIKFFNNRSKAEGEIASTVEGTARVWTTDTETYFYSTGQNWRTVLETAQLVKSYDPKTARPNAWHYYAWKGRGSAWRKLGNCVMEVYGELFAPEFPANYNYEPIPERGPYASKLEAVQVGKPLLQREIADSGNGLLAAAAGNPALQEFCKAGLEEVSASPSPSPTPSPEPECVVKDTQIRFEPTQGVWQDDYFFEDMAGKELSEHDSLAVTQEYRAAIPMIKGRNTLLFGVRWNDTVSGVAADPGRKKIVVRGTTTGTASVNSKLSFSLRQADGTTKTIYESPANIPVPLGRPCGPERPFEYNYSADLGLPEGGTFTFDAAGQYELKARLLRADTGAPTGFEGRVVGPVVETRPPRVHFVPLTVKLGIVRRADSEQTMAWTKNLSQASAKYMQDYLPVAAGSVGVVLEPGIRYLDQKIVEADGKWKKLQDKWGWLKSEEEKLKNEFDLKIETVMAALADEIGTAGLLGNADRIFAVINEDDTKTIFNFTFQGYTASRKVIFVPVLPEYDGPHDSVAHELIHSVPFLWSNDEMLRDCSVDYHNTNWKNVSHGFRIDYGGAPAATRKHLDTGGYSIMGLKTIVNSPGSRNVYNETHYDTWADQCTYWHLANALQTKPDPKLLVVRGFAARSGENQAASLMPLYQIDGEPDLDNSSKGSWEIALRDADGTILGRYLFEPEWIAHAHPSPIERKVVSFLHTVPFDTNARRVEIYSPGAEIPLDSLELSPNAPTVRITSPENNTKYFDKGEPVKVKWQASDADSGELAYTVLYSSDGGENWRQEAFETGDTSLQVYPDDSAFEHLVKVIATDGTRSGETVVAFNIGLQVASPSPLPVDVEPTPPSAQGLPSNLKTIKLDLSFLPKPLLDAFGEGYAKLTVYDTGTPTAYFFKLSGGKLSFTPDVDAPGQQITISVTRSVLDAVENSVDKQNALKLAVERDAARIEIPDAAKQAALGIFKQTVKGEEFKPQPGSEVEFHGKKAVVVQGPAGRPALSIAGEKFLPVMSRYGSPFGASLPNALELLKKARQGEAASQEREGGQAGTSRQEVAQEFSENAGVLAADPSTGRPLLEPRAELVVQARDQLVISRVKDARLAYKAGLDARKAYREATGKKG